MKWLSPPFFINLSLGLIELVLATEEGTDIPQTNFDVVSHLGTTATIITVFYEFVKLLVTSGAILLLWNAGFYVTCYTLALVPYIILVPALIILISKSGRYTQMIVQ